MSFSWVAGLDPDDLEDAEVYVCQFCQREKHGRCREKDCSCCGGQP